MIGVLSFAHDELVNGFLPILDGVPARMSQFICQHVFEGVIISVQKVPHRQPDGIGGVRAPGIFNHKQVIGIGAAAGRLQINPGQFLALPADFVKELFKMPGFFQNLPVASFDKTVAEYKKAEHHKRQ